MQNYNQYKEVDITTADSGKLIILLYDGAINFLKKAKEGIDEANVEKKCANLNKAHDIIQELQYSLRMDVGGEIARNLNSLYQFMITHLIKAKISRNGIKNVDEVIFMMKSLNEAWREIQTRPDVHQIKAVNRSTQQGMSRGIAV